MLKIRIASYLTALMLTGAGVVAGQATSAVALAAPQADSATQARAAYRRAVAAYRQRDLATARQEMRRAAESWPTQQVYLESAAGLAALARDTVDASQWLGRLADLGVGTSVSGDTSYRTLVGATAFDNAAARLASAVGPMVKSRVRLTVPDTMFHAEGAAFDARSSRWFVGSVRQRRVVSIDRNGAVREFVAPAADGIAGVFGMAVDATRRTLWMATTALPRMEGFSAADSGRVGVYGYDLDTGKLRRRAWALRDSSTVHTFGDVAVAPNGDVYVSDSQAPWIYVLPLGADSLVRFVTHPLFRSAQGMAITADGRTMFVADYSHGLMRVDMQSRAVTPLRGAPGVTMLGVDGLYLHRGSLIGVQNGVVPARLVRFCLGTDQSSVTQVEVLDRNPVADEPTLGAVVGDSAFYIATSQWEKFDDAGARTKRGLSAATLLGVGLSDKPCATSTRTK